MDDTRSSINRRNSALQTERSSFIESWKDLNDYILPRQARFYTTDRNKGDRRNIRINDSTATLAAGTLMGGMMGGLTDPSRPWFNLRTVDPDLDQFGPVKQWLAIARDRMNEVFLGSNLYTTLPNTYLDLGVFATNAFAVMEDVDKIIHCHTFPVGSYCLAQNDKGKIDTFYRAYQMTVAQLVRRFGRDNCSGTVRSLYDRSSYDAWVEVVHAVETNEDFDPSRLHAKFKKYRSIYMEPAGNDNTLLSESGFDDFPIMASRWRVLGEDIYGYGPGWDAIGDVKALQVEQKRKMEAIAKQVNPPMVGPGTLRNTNISVLPGAITFQDNVAQQDGLRPTYQVNLNLSDLREDINEVQGRIKRCFYEDLFRMLADIQHGQMTAQEVAERQQEKMLLLGPVLERLNDELFDPLIDRTFNIMLKHKLFPTPPPELAGLNLNVEYTSIMAQAQKLSGISGVQQLCQFTGNLGQADPNAIDKIDFDKTIDIMADMLGVPPQMIRDDKTVAAIRQQKAQQQQAQQQMAMAQSAAQTGKTMADTQVTQPSALSAMMSQLKGTG